MTDELQRLLLEAIQTQIRDKASPPTFSWTDGLNQMTLGIWAVGSDDRDRPFLSLGGPDEETSARTGNSGTIYLDQFYVAGLHHGLGNQTRFDLKKSNGAGDYFVWVAGDWRLENLASAPGRQGPAEPDRII